MTGTDLAKAMHNALMCQCEAYGKILDTIGTENAALRVRVAQLEGELTAVRRQIPKDSDTKPEKA